MRIATIDLGTNSVRFDVHEIAPDNQVYPLHREKLMIRLGEGVFLKHRLDQRSMRVCVDAFLSFKRTIQDFHVSRIVAFGTSALREAKDADKFIRYLHRKTGIRLKIISGDEEARLIARGILANEKKVRGNFALIDIGGGSTEISVCSGQRILASASFPLGTARLQQLFLKTNPPPLDPRSGKQPAIEAMRRHIRGVLLFKLVSEDWPKVRKVIASSGTARTLVKIFKKETGEDSFHRDQLQEFIQSARTMKREELLQIPGMEARRVDMILAGSILLQECLFALHAEEVLPTEFSLRDGILAEQIEMLRDRQGSLEQDPLKDLFFTARELGADPEELKQALKISEQLFDKLAKVHRLHPRWKHYLLAASLLHDSGWTISPIDPEAHSAYIARYSDTPYYEEWESRLLEELCFHSKNGKIAKPDMPFKKHPELQRAFLKLLSLLRLTAALSFQRSKPITVERVAVNGKRVRILFSRRHSPELALLRAELRKSLFEELFKKQVSLELV